MERPATRWALHFGGNMAPTLRRCPFCGGEVYAREVIIIGGTEEYEIRHRDEDAAYRDNCPMVVGLYPSEGELIAAWNYSK